MGLLVCVQDEQVLLGVAEVQGDAAVGQGFDGWLGQGVEHELGNVLDQLGLAGGGQLAGAFLEVSQGRDEVGGADGHAGDGSGAGPHTFDDRFGV